LGKFKCFTSTTKVSSNGRSLRSPRMIHKSTTFNQSIQKVSFQHQPTLSIFQHSIKFNFLPSVPCLLRSYATFKVSDNHHFLRSSLLSVERKGKGNKGGKGGKKKDDDDDEDTAFEFDIDAQKSSFQPSIDHLKREFENLKMNRVSPSSLDSVNVTTADGMFPLTKIGQVIIKDPQTLQVTLYDEQHLKAAEKAVRDSPLGFTPLIEGNALKVKVPKPTKELRDSIVKMANQHAENAKNSIRNARKTCLDKVKKAKPSQDDERAAEKKIQALVDDYNKTITNMLNTKVKELSNI